MSPATFCRECGTELELRSKPSGKFDTRYGLPTFYRWYVCPRTRTGWRRVADLVRPHTVMWYGEGT